MKKIAAMVLPSLLIFLFIYVDSHFPESKYILLGIYLVFPTLFIIQGIVTSDSRVKTIIALFVSSLIIMVTTSLWYNMTSMLIPVIIYFILGLTSFLLMNKNKKNSI